CRGARRQRPAAGAGHPRPLSAGVGAPGHAWLLAMLLAAAAPLQAALRIDVDPAGLAAAELEASHALAARALGLLPPEFERDLDASVELRWRDDLPTAVHGRAHDGRIALRRSLLDGWTRRDA